MVFFSAQGNVIAPHDSESVANAKLRHHTLYEQIAQDHARIGAEREAERALFESTSEADVAFDDIPAEYDQHQNYHHQWDVMRRLMWRVSAMRIDLSMDFVSNKEDNFYFINFN